MKTIIFLILFIPVLSFSQRTIEYVSVFPTDEGRDEQYEYSNSAIFDFFINSADNFYYGECIIIGYITDVSNYPLTVSGVASAWTGYQSQYCEDSFKMDSPDGFFRLKISTDNLPKLMIGVVYSGEQSNVKLNNVKISFNARKEGY